MSLQGKLEQLAFVDCIGSTLPTAGPTVAQYFAQSFMSLRRLLFRSPRRVSSCTLERDHI